MIKKILALAINEMKMEFSERSTLIFFLVLPIVFTFLIGIGLNNLYGSDPDVDPRLPVLVVNSDEGELSKDLLEIMSGSEVIRPVVKEAEEAQTLFEDGKAAALLEIPANFSSSLLENQPLSLDLHFLENNLSVSGIKQELSFLLQKMDAAVVVAQEAARVRERQLPFESEAEKQTFLQESLTEAQILINEPSFTTRFVTGGAAEEELTIPTGFEQSATGQIVTWVLITLLGSSVVFVNERLGGTLKRLMVSPTSKAVILGGKILGRLLMGLLQMAILIGFSAFVLGVNWGHSFWGLVLLLLAFALTGTALGVLLGALARTRKQADGLSVLLSMLLASMGGAWWPLEVTPTAFQTVVKVLPSTWAMIGFTDLISRGQGFVDILPEAGILLGFAAVFFVIGLKKLSYE